MLHVDTFFDTISEQFPMFKKTMEAYKSDLNQFPTWHEDAKWVFDFVHELASKHELNDEALLDAFAEFCIEYLREQAYFLNSGEYSSAGKSFHEVCEHTYSNSEYMTSYMIGYVISCAAFPHHYQQLRFFREALLPLVPESAKCLECGVGHGLYLGSLLMKDGTRQGVGYDISPTSVALAKSAMEILGTSKQATILEGDVVEKIKEHTETFDVIIASGLLEHLEDPEQFLMSVKEKMTPESLLFTMTPTNTSHPDHLIHYETTDQISDMFSRCGMHAVEELIVDMSDGNDQVTSKMVLRVDKPA